MKILKVINNNVVSAYNDNGKEIVVVGKGIGFQKKNGDSVKQELVEKVFLLNDGSASEFEEIIRNMPYEYIRVASKIISNAKKCLDKELNKNIYITLTDHLNYAITRAKQNIIVENALLWEIKRFYHQEYRIGMDAVDIIRKELGVELPEDEAGFFALHIVNAEMDADMKQTSKVPNIIKDILNIVSYTLGIEMNQNDLYYERFITHLKFFLERIFRNDMYESDYFEFNNMVKKNFPDSYRCALRIGSYIQAALQYKVCEEELTYLAIHIQNMIRRR
ncbi:MAG: PRD domain-containing protein [Lachnospiraceae bacterium]|nr:PRD domain-containing protein [Lachnospiraceae bacterium]